VATDLDGTLLDPSGQVSARTRAVLYELDAIGVPVVFTTGRPVRWMADLWDAVGGHGLAICSNGGIVYDVTRREVRDFWPVPREVGVAIAEQVRVAVPGTQFAIEHTTGWASEVDFPSHPDDLAELSADDLRGRFIAGDLFSPGELSLVYSHHDRMVLGGAMPLPGKPLVLEAPEYLRTEPFLDRRDRHSQLLLAKEGVPPPRHLAHDRASWDRQSRLGRERGLRPGASFVPHPARRRADRRALRARFRQLRGSARRRRGSRYRSRCAG
jgi:hypothetical protein